MFHFTVVSFFARSWQHFFFLFALHLSLNLCSPFFFVAFLPPFSSFVHFVHFVRSLRSFTSFVCSRVRSFVRSFTCSEWRNNNNNNNSRDVSPAMHRNVRPSSVRSSVSHSVAQPTAKVCVCMCARRRRCVSSLPLVPSPPCILSCCCAVLLP